MPLSQVKDLGSSNATAGMVLATGGYDFSVRLWQVTTGACAKVCQHPESHVISLAVTPDRRSVAAAGYQGIRLYDAMGNGQGPINKFDRLVKNVMSVGFNSTGQWMFSGGEDGLARIFDLRGRSGGGPAMYCCLKVERPVMTVALHPTKQEMFVGVQTGSIHVMDLRSKWNEEWSIDTSDVAVLSLSPHPSGQLLAAASSSGLIYLYTIGDAIPASVQAPAEGISGSYVCSVSQLSGTPTTFRAHSRHVLKCAFSPDGRFLATVSADKTARIWRVWMSKSTPSSPVVSYDTAESSQVQIGATQVCSLPHPLPHMWIWDCAWTADSQHIFTACADKVVRLWALPSEVISGKQPPSPPLSPVDGESFLDDQCPKASLELEYLGHQRPVVALAYAGS